MHECDAPAHMSMLCAHLPGSPWPSSGRGMHTLGAQSALGKTGLGKTWRQALEVGLGHLGKGLGGGPRYPACGLEGTDMGSEWAHALDPVPCGEGHRRKSQAGP